MAEFVKQDVSVTSRADAAGRRVVLFPPPTTGRLISDATTVFENPQKSGINTLTPANAAHSEGGCFSLHQLPAKTFAYANAPFAYANPSRGDVSPLLPIRKHRLLPLPGRNPTL